MKSVELFAGAGGLAIGLEKAGFEPKIIVEYNKDACSTLRKNYLVNKDSYLFEGDIKKFNYNHSDILNNSSIQLVSGGPPCQPFSLGGKHEAHNDNRDMFPEAVRAVREIKPRAFIFENVKGLLRKSFEDYFKYILLQLQYPLIMKNDYESWKEHLSILEKYNNKHDESVLEYNLYFKLLNASDYGIPQKRERVFIVGFRKDLNISWSFPEATHSEDALFWEQWITEEYWHKYNIPKPVMTDKIRRKISAINKKYGMFAPEKLAWRTVREALIDLPSPCVKNHKYSNHEYKDGAKIYPGHTGSYIDEPSKTLKAGAHGVPGGENMIRFEDGSVRYFSVRESARIQTFPDDYYFEGAWGESMRQLGNAVPVELARIIGKSIFDALSICEN